MGAPKQKWTPEEEEALRAGVAKHGTGKWKNIQKDPEFFDTLAARSNIDLKDKWRNMSVSASGQGSRGDKLRPVKVKTPPSATLQIPSSSAQVAEDASEDAVMESTKSVPDGKTVPPRYNTMIFEALSTLSEPNGSEISAIINYIEQRHEVPPNFRRLLSSKLRRLVQQNKLEKINKCYKIKKDITFGTRTPAPKQKDVRPSKPHNSKPHNTGITLFETVTEAAVSAAYKIVDAESKSFLASEAVKEAERVAKMAEDTESMLQLAREIFEQCKYKTENVHEEKSCSWLEDVNQGLMQIASTVICYHAITSCDWQNASLSCGTCFICRRKKDFTSGTRMPAPKQKDVRPSNPQKTITTFKTVTEAAATAAYKIADADKKSFVASKAVKEAERAAKMAEDTESMLQLAKEIFEQCNTKQPSFFPIGSTGEIVLVA